METQTNSPKKKPGQKQTGPQTGEENLQGTFAAVLIVGGIILLSWFGVFGLFLERA
ncbi:cytochrome c oxidase subunit 2A [Brevibacillus choshinensis]|uniref:Cytochrome c oxidase subunit 2A n=1 Tax=Brevibacillus choshinensis TaxID=54911 RepID=A0ABX7FR40_BRECH|nr:cytochrome c oxidase subunit 2A [Brevibacillus choshinensis]QRG68064.1 cytochrome c oxidase subunit 2A [Brevibacillus choshinensis]